jgi:hypothetical protein
METDLTDSEREALALKRLMSAMSGGTKSAAGGGNSKFKTLVRKSILQNQLETGGMVKGMLPKEPQSGGLPAPDDPDLVPPNVVLELWFMVADGVVDENGEFYITWTFLLYYVLRLSLSS